MKHNLKNRPKPKQTDLYPTWKVEEWFEGFEKELRACYKWCGRPAKDCAECDITAKTIIKEILGE